MAKKKKPSGKPTPPDKDPSLKPLYDEYRKKFSAADLQKYTRIEKGIPIETVIAEMEAIQAAVERRKA